MESLRPASKPWAIIPIAKNNSENNANCNFIDNHMKVKIVCEMIYSSYVGHLQAMCAKNVSSDAY